VCRTNSIPTDNGAYITLKNCARQVSPSRESRTSNKPLILNMLLKKSRIEPAVAHRYVKMKKYEPSLNYSGGGLCFEMKESSEMRKSSTTENPMSTADNHLDTIGHSMNKTNSNLHENFNICDSTNDSLVSSLTPLVRGNTNSNKLFSERTSPSGSFPSPPFTSHDALTPHHPYHEFGSTAIINFPSTSDTNIDIDYFSHPLWLSGESVTSDTSKILHPYGNTPFPDLDGIFDVSRSNSPTVMFHNSRLCSSNYDNEFTSLLSHRPLPSELDSLPP